MRKIPRNHPGRRKMPRFRVTSMVQVREQARYDACLIRLLRKPAPDDTPPAITRVPTMTPEGPRTPQLPDVLPDTVELPSGIDRRAFMMRSALVGAVSVMAGCSAPTPQQQAAAPAPAAPPMPAAPALS